MDNLGDKVLQKIKEEHICSQAPLAVFAQGLFHLAFFFGLSDSRIARFLRVAASMSCPRMIGICTNIFTRRLVGHILISIPYLWIVLFGGFCFDRPL